jgi:hypothetical protein
MAFGSKFIAGSLVVLLGLGVTACKQVAGERPVEPDAAGAEQVEVMTSAPAKIVEREELNTAATEMPSPMKRPVGAVNTPGPGVPSGGTDQQIQISDIAGDWTMVTGDGASGVAISLVASDSPAAGRVVLRSTWTDESDPPTRWIYLALGQLTLVDENGAIVWNGAVADAQSFNTSMTVLDGVAAMVRD